MPSNTVDNQPAGGTALGTDKLLGWRAVGGSISLTAAGLALYILASPTLTGTPTAPTASPGTNTTQIATTEFVTAAVTAGGYTTEDSQDAFGAMTTGGSLCYTDATPLATVCSSDFGDISTSSNGTSWQIDANAVGASEIAADAVGTSEIATDGVGSAEIAADAVGASELAAGSLTNADAASMAAGTIKGRNTASSGVPEDLAASSARIVLGAEFITRTLSSGVATVPQPGVGLTELNYLITNTVTTDTFEIQFTTVLEGAAGLVIITNGSGASPYDTPTWKLDGSGVTVANSGLSYATGDSCANVFQWVDDGTRLLVWLDATSCP